MSVENFDELACTYAALILHDTGISITAENISSILKASDVTVEPYWPGIFASFLTKENVADLLSNVGGSSSATAAPVAGDSGAPAPAKEPTPPPSSSSEGDMGLGLFG